MQMSQRLWREYFFTSFESLFVEKSYLDFSSVVSFSVSFPFVRRLIDALYLVRPML